MSSLLPRAVPKEDQIVKRGLIRAIHFFYQPVSSSTVARWLKETIAAAGIDTTIFKAEELPHL